MSIIPLWVKLVAVGVIFAALVVYYNVHVNGLIKERVTEAVTERDTSWRDAEAKAIEKAKAQAQVTEAAHAKDLAVIQAQRQKDDANAKAKHDKDVAAARSGALSLRIPSNCPSAVNLPGAASGGNPAFTTSELPREITASLFSIANDADALVGELNSCWQIVASDRKVSP